MNTEQLSYEKDLPYVEFCAEKEILRKYSLREALVEIYVRHRAENLLGVFFLRQ